MARIIESILSKRRIIQLTADDVILDEQVVDFYSQFSNTADVNNDTVQLDIPLQYQEEMRRYLEELKSKSH